MTASICHAEAQLLKRNELLEDLWAIDNELRDLHAHTRWQDCASARQTIHDMAEHRQLLSQELVEMGAAPWCFNISEDNSFLVQARKELADQGTGHATIEACASTPNSNG